MRNSFIPRATFVSAMSVALLLVALLSHEQTSHAASVRAHQELKR